MFDHTYHFRVIGDVVEFNGLDEPDSRLHHLAPGHQLLVVKVPGHKYWSSRGQQSYAGADLRIIKLLYFDPETGRGSGLGLVDVPVTADLSTRDRLAAVKDLPTAHPEGWLHIKMVVE